MPTSKEIEIRGLEETKRKLEQVAGDIHGKPMVNAMKKSVLLIERSAKINLSKPTEGVQYPTVNFGRLRNSITGEVYSKRDTLYGVTGTNVKHAPYMELGTGIPAGRPRTAPPYRVIKQWAEQKSRGGKKVNAYLAWRAIKKRGGLKPRKYLQRAFDQNKREIEELLDKTVSAVVRK